MKNRYFCQTKRLYLRPLQEADASDMFEYTSNINSCTFLTWDAHTNIAQDKEFIKNALKKKDEVFVAIELIVEKKMIGVIHIYNVCAHISCEISYIINPCYSRMGYATEAVEAITDYLFNTKKIKHVQAICITENIASELVMKKAGMHHESIKENAILIKGVLRDINIYSKTNGEEP